jgi:hypothetical protein
MKQLMVDSSFRNTINNEDMEMRKEAFYNARNEMNWAL